MDALGQPDRAFRSIVIAGTNGKGSVTAMVERGLRASGLRTGRYTSPHLVDLEERFAVDGTPIDTSTLDTAADKIRAVSATLRHPPSFFEATTAVALDVFRSAAVDIAVLEVGMGGRLDATNVVTGIAAAITSVELDHEQYLGNTLAAIAREKAGIIKPGIPVVLAENPAEIEAVVAEACDSAGARLVRAAEGVSVRASVSEGRTILDLVTPRHTFQGLRMSLRGAHQIANAVTAVRLLETLDDEGLAEIPRHAIQAALEDVVWPARLELVSLRGLTLLIDGAHNPAGGRALARFVRSTYPDPLPHVVGIMRDKKIDAIIEALAPGASHFAFARVSSPRAALPEDIAAVAARVAPSVGRSIFSDPEAAVRHAATLGSPVVVAGSLYLAGQVRKQFS